MERLCLRSVLLTLFSTLIILDLAFSQQWRGLSFTFVGRDTFLIPYDGPNPKAKLRVVNTSGTYTPTRIVPRAVPPAGYPESGFATFPNGGYVYLAPFETTYVTCWLKGVYERSIPNGVFTKEISFTFQRNVSTDTSSYSISKVYVFNNLSQNIGLSGPLSFSGKVILGRLPARGPINVSVGTIHETAFISTTQIDSGVQFSTTLPSRDDLYLKASSDGFKTKYLRIDPKSPSNIKIVLEPQSAALGISFQYLTSFKTMTGFWRGAVSESEKTVALFPGQENWRMNGSCFDSATVSQSKIYKCAFSGQVLWSYAPGWQTWGGEMSRDGKYVAYVLNSGRWPGCYGPPWTIALLDGSTGTRIWEKVGERIYESLEVDISNNSSYIAVGTGSQISLLDRATGNVLWTRPPLTEPADADTGYGQVRRMRFDARDEYLYAASGDSHLRKIRVSDGAVVWKCHIWGWAWLNGLNISPDGSMIVAGTKSGDVTMVRTSDGKILWTRETGNFDDVVFSPNGKLVATYTGRVFDALSGELVGIPGRTSPPYFANDSVLCKLVNEVAVFTPTGELVYRSPNPTDISSKPGEQVQWAYLSSDNTAILAARDMSTPPQTGVVFYQGSITTIVAAPLAPLLAGPDHTARNVSITPTLSWAKTIGAVTYRLQVSLSSAFSTTVLNDSTITDTLKVIGPLQNNTLYYWRVNAKNEGGTSAWSQTRSFTTIVAVPQAPTLAGPVDSSRNMSITPILSWAKATGATTYRLQVSVNAAFSTTVVNDSTITDTTKAIGPLLNNTVYYWRASAKNEGGTSPWSQARSFATVAALPQTPTLAAPADTARNVSITPTLSWAKTIGAVTYRLQVSLSSAFSTTVLNDSTITDTLKVVGPLQNNTLYYWRVNAKNEGGTSAWSQTRSFTTIVAVPQAPTLAAPADSAKNVQLNTTLSWNAASGAALYHLQVSTAATFSSTTVDDSTISSNSRSIGSLSLATSYYWRVRAKNLGGWSAFSSLRQFSTIRTTSIEQLGNGIPTEYSLSQNYPNPFNPSTTIQFALPKGSQVTLKVFDLLGREVATLVSQELGPGYFTVRWQADVPSGTYIYRLQAGEFVETKKMLLLH